MAKLDISDLRKLLGWGSQTAPKIIDDVAIETGPLANLIPTEAVEVGPQVLGKGTRAADDVAEAIDADFSDVVPKTPSRMDPRLAKIAATLGLVGGGAAMMGGGDEPPMTPQALAKQSTPSVPSQPIMSDDLAAKAIHEANNQGGFASQTSRQSPIAQQEAPSPVSDELSYEDELKEAQDSSNQNTFFNNLLRAGNQAGAGIASLGAGQNVKADYSGVDALGASAGQPLKDVKERFGAKKDSQAYKKAQDELGDEAKMRDPNSEVSKLTTELAAKAGLIKPGQAMSAMALKNSGVNLGNLLSTIEAGKARKESADLQREAMSSAKDTTNKLKIQGSVDRQVTQLLKSKDMEAYNAAKDAAFALDTAMESDDDKIKGGAAFMQYAKIAQGDNSVVRDGDMAQLAGKYNYTSVGDMFNKLKAQANGGNFGSTELAAMKEVAKLTQQIKGRRVKELMSPIVKRTETSGLDISESLDPSVVKEFGPGEQQAKNVANAGTRTFKSAHPVGAIVTVKSGQKYRIGADGVTGTEI